MNAHVTIATIIRAARDTGFSLKGHGLQTAIAASAAASCASDGDEVEPNHVADLSFTGEGGDLYNGAVFAKLYRDKLLFVHETGEVLRFDERSGWLSAAPGTAERAGKAVVGVLKDAASDKAQITHVARLCDVNDQRAMIEMAKSEPGMTVRLSDFDNDPMLLGVTNGVLDLKTGTLTPVSPEVLISKRSNVAYDPGATCPRFDKFMREVQPDPHVRAFLQRWMGYCLTGRTDARKFAFLYGHGANGKSVFVELMAWLLDDYARKIQTEMLMHHQRNPQAPSPDIVSLKGMRLVYANETEEGRHFDAARLKDLTGGVDTLTGRVPYGKANITFSPTHKLVIVGNHKPEVSDTSDGMWDRVLLIPFGQTFPDGKRDPHLLHKLKGEGSGILNWMLAGLRDYLAHGLQVPPTIKTATDAYRDEQDIIGEWIRDNCNTGAGYSVAKRELYISYTTWAAQNGHKPLAQGRLTRRLADRRFPLSPDRRKVQGLTPK